MVRFPFSIFETEVRISPAILSGLAWVIFLGLFIIVDEFQDTDIEQWEIVKLLSEDSRIIALADPNQRIYDFRGADPARIGQFIKQLEPEQFDFENQNNRSLNTDINIFGNDLLTGENQRKRYNDVKISAYPSYGRNRQKLLEEIEIISNKRANYKLTGNPWEDWKSNLEWRCCT